MKTIIVTFKCALSNQLKAVEFENCTTEMSNSEAKIAASKKYGGPIIFVSTEVIEQSISYFQA